MHTLWNKTANLVREHAKCLTRGGTLQATAQAFLDRNGPPSARWPALQVRLNCFLIMIIDI